MLLNVQAYSRHENQACFKVENIVEMDIDIYEILAPLSSVFWGDPSSPTLASIPASDTLVYTYTLITFFKIVDVLVGPIYGIGL